MKVIVLCDVTPCNLVEMFTSLCQVATCLIKVHGGINHKTNFKSSLLFCRILVQICETTLEFQLN